jgi:hypothetical protein
MAILNVDIPSQFRLLEKVTGGAGGATHSEGTELTLAQSERF